jgi:hypothetical protein
MRDPVAPGAEYRREALAALAADDWHRAYEWAKGWISSGGGAWIPDPWLVYVASSLLHGQPRTAVHSLDLALKHWIVEPPDRAILLWVRGDVIRRQLKDPKTAIADLAHAAENAPAWLRDTVETDRGACLNEAESSRKRKPSVAEAPDYKGPGTAADTVARPEGQRLAGARPAVWDALLPRLG